MLRLLAYIIGIGMIASSAYAEEKIVDHNKMLMDHGGGHLMDFGGGMVMGQNTDILPGGCDRISATKEITVHAGHKYAKPFPGRMFAFDVQEYQFEPCTKLTVTLVNEDNVRHQWMMHNLPKYIYPKGMFHLEVTGPGKISGTLILPAIDKTYLVHCDIAQHMEKGMKGQLKVGKGSGDLPSIPGVTPYVIEDSYVTEALPEVEEIIAEVPESAIAGKQPEVENDSIISGVMVIGLAVGFLLSPFLARKFKGMSSGEIIAYLIDLVKISFEYFSKYSIMLFTYLSKLVSGLVQLVSSSTKS